MPRSRKDAWLRDEIILALDLYQREGRNPSTGATESTSQELRSIPVEAHLADDPQFRNAAAVKLKIANFVALNPDATTAGMSRGSRLDEQVFAELWGDPARLQATSAAIRANLRSKDASSAGAESLDDEVEDAPEGRVLTRVHRYRERSQRLRRRKKEEALRQNGQLQCDACGFDFEARYGERGSGFMEVHHIVPVHELKPEARTQLDDLALLCANCHRMIHSKSPWLTVDELRERIEQSARAQKP